MSSSRPYRRGRAVPGSAGPNAPPRTRAPYVVERRTDRRGQLLSRGYFQPNGLGWHRHRHPLRLAPQDEGTQVHVIARGRTGHRGSAAHQSAQRGFLLARQAAELGRLAARLGPAPLHQGQANRKTAIARHSGSALP